MRLKQRKQGSLTVMSVCLCRFASYEPHHGQSPDGQTWGVRLQRAAD